MPRGVDTRFDPRRQVGREKWEHMDDEFGGGPSPSRAEGMVGWSASAEPTPEGRYRAHVEAASPTSMADAQIYGGDETVRMSVPKPYRTENRALIAGQVLGERLSDERDKPYDVGLRPGNAP